MIASFRTALAATLVACVAGLSVDGAPTRRSADAHLPMRVLSLSWVDDSTLHTRQAPKPEIAGNATSGLKSTAKAGRVFQIDDSPDPHKTFQYLEVQDSHIPRAGRGCFATKGLESETLLGEYRGQHFMLGEKGAKEKLQMEWPYIWKVPRCKAQPGRFIVVTRHDKALASQCSTDNGFVYVDAEPMDDEAENPLRYVNGVMNQTATDAELAKESNVEVFFEDDRVFYYTSRPVEKDEELLVDYGRSYWSGGIHDHRGGAGGSNLRGQSADGFKMDWGDYVKDK